MNAKTAPELKLMEDTCRLAALTLEHTGRFVRAGITTNELDQIALDFILSHGAISSCVGYHGYPKAICTSVNHVICHGVPDETVLADGDMINLDVTVYKHGFHGDTSATFFVGEVSEQVKKLTACAKDAMMAGIAAVRAGATTGDVGFAVGELVTKRGFYAVREIGGHGIGREFHEDPFVPSHGRKRRGTPLIRGATITVEPMVNETPAPIYERKIDGSDITVIETSDGRLSAQFEHTILVTDSGARILTLLD